MVEKIEKNQAEMEKSLEEVSKELSKSLASIASSFKNIPSPSGRLPTINFDELLEKFAESKILVLPPDRGYISKSLINKLKEIEGIQYKTEIKYFIHEFERSSKDLYTIIIETLERLWVTRYKKGEGFKMFDNYKEFEKILLKDPFYRDHFIHQFQVFLTGCPIIKELYEDIRANLAKNTGCKNLDDVNVDFAWMITSTFHDVGYPIERFESWLNSFFKDYLDVEGIPTGISFGNILLEKKFMEYLDKLSSLYFFIFTDNKRNKQWKYDQNPIIDYPIRNMFMDKLINQRNHGLISAICLLDRIENSAYARKIKNYVNTIFSASVFPAALAIALHDKDVFSNEKIGLIEFKRTPLLFLLIYCDTLQEWGRPHVYIPKDFDATDIELADIDIKPDSVSATLNYKKNAPFIDGYGKKKHLFQEKQNEVSNIFKKIKSKDPIFSITLKLKNEIHTYSSE
jgi:hypothetical protein